MQPLTSHSAIKRIIAAGVAGLAAIATLAGGLAATSDAQAASSDPAAGEIVVSGAEAGLTVSAYKIISGPFDTDPQWRWNSTLAEKIATTKDGEPDYSGYVKGVSKVDGVWTAPNPAPVDSSFGNLSADTKPGIGASADFYDWLAATIKNDSTFAEPVSDTTDGAGSVSLDVSGTDANKGDGAYLVILEEGTNVYKPSVVTVTTTSGGKTGKGAEIDVKATIPSIDKTTPTDSVQKGDTVPFTITTDVPTYPANAIDTKYVIGDKPSYGLDVDTDTITVYLGTESADGNSVTWQDTALDPSKYDATTIDVVPPDDTATPPVVGNGKGFTLDFTDHYAAIKGYKIKVEYKAKVTRVVEAGDGGVSNGATLKYRNDPYAVDGYNTISTETKTDCDHDTEDCGGEHITRYAYGFHATKVGSDDMNTGLANAQFKLYKQDTEGNYNEIQVYEVTKGTKGVYNPATDRENAEHATITSDSDGTLKITGLWLGKYQLRETVAPDDNHTMIDSEFELKDTNKDGKLDASGEVDGNGDPVADTDGIFEYGNIVDPLKFSLATTGAAGIALMVLAALAVVGASTTLIVRRRADRKA